METDMIAVVGVVALVMLVLLAGIEVLISHFSSDELGKMGVERRC